MKNRPGSLCEGRGEVCLSLRQTVCIALGLTVPLLVDQGSFLALAAGGEFSRINLRGGDAFVAQFGLQGFKAHAVVEV